MGKFSFLKPSSYKASSSSSPPAPEYSSNSFDNGSNAHEPIAGSSTDIYDPYAPPDPFRSNVIPTEVDNAPSAHIQQPTAHPFVHSPSMTNLAPPPHIASSSTSRSSSPGPPITLTWEQEVALPVGSTANDFETSTLDEPTDFPPSYEAARVPEQPVTYTFSKLGRTSGSGLLIPPSDSPDTRPLYYIAVSMDFMWPSCVVTSIFKGSNEDGNYIGGFTTILSVYPGNRAMALTSLQTVTHKNKEMAVDRVFELFKTKNAMYVYRWRSRQPRHGLIWVCPNWPMTSDGTIKCSKLLYPEVTIATYNPNKRVVFSVLSQVPAEPTLTVTPEGHVHLDDIILSLLLLEKERLAFSHFP